MPTASAVILPDCPEHLTPEHRALFAAQGYLAVRRLLSESEVAGARAALARTVQRFIAEAAAGKARYQPPRAGTGNYDGARIGYESSRSMLLFEPQIDPLALVPADAEMKVRNLYYFEQEDPLFQRMVDDPRIKGLAGALIEDEPLLFQTMALSKPPRIGVEKPWHQDNAYFRYTPLELIVGVWIALDEARTDNGCMHVLPGWHRRGGLRHVHTFDCQISPDRLRLEDAVPIELSAGGALFFAGMLPHQTPPNRSDQRRRALQFHYRGSRTQEVESSQYDQTFAEPDGTPASCAAAKKGQGGS